MWSLLIGDKVLRKERDLIGELEIDSNAYYGVQTKRAINNFKISGVKLSDYSDLVVALAMTKKAAAKSNLKLGYLEKNKADAICEACSRIIEGEFHDQFLVDMIQGGAGTSTNMNANEVIANVALEAMGFEKGGYEKLHPTNEVNMSQSTNDVYPTAIRIGVLLGNEFLVKNLSSLCESFYVKGEEFRKVIKMGRTQLQDAVPMTLGQEFNAFYSMLREDLEHLTVTFPPLMCEVNLGGTAIGTGINTDPSYKSTVVGELAKISGYPLVPAKDLVEATSDMGAFVLFSSMLKRLAIKLSKICNDIRLLSSGPRTGFNEINIPARQAGSSIMPGKVNPVIPEAVNQIAYEVIGNDLSLTMSAESGQLQLNAMEPLIAFKILSSIRLLDRAMVMLKEYCVDGITANEKKCKESVEKSIGVITALNPYIGYENSARIAKEALDSDLSVMELVERESLIEVDKLREIMSVENMVSPKKL